MLISVSNDTLTPYSSPLQVSSGWRVHYKPIYGNILAISMSGNVYVNTVLMQTFTVNQGGQFTLDPTEQAGNFIKFATFNITTGLVTAVWNTFPSPPDSFTIVANYSYNTATENPAFFPTHVDGD